MCTQVALLLRCHRYWSVLGYGVFLGRSWSRWSLARLHRYRHGLLQCHGTQFNASTLRIHLVLCVAVSQISLGEMVAYLPIPGGHIKLAERFVDRAFSLTMGWNYWYNWTVILPAELSAAAVLMTFWKSVCFLSAISSLPAINICTPSLMRSAQQCG